MKYFRTSCPSIHVSLFSFIVSFDELAWIRSERTQWDTVGTFVFLLFYGGGFIFHVLIVHYPSLIPPFRSTDNQTLCIIHIFSVSLFHFIICLINEKKRIQTKSSGRTMWPSAYRSGVIVPRSVTDLFLGGCHLDQE